MCRTRSLLLPNLCGCLGLGAECGADSQVMELRLRHLRLRLQLRLRTVVIILPNLSRCLSLHCPFAGIMPLRLY